ncbi:DUF2865 domain-containing protein, partial [Pseudovibrio flavus]|uniref:DUF2865 domain-containing protein n=1 Tax=Pseudovibrio flavus TaxID=2529854 RepID=UPI00211BDFA2
YAPPSIPVEPQSPQTSTTYSASSGSVNSNGSDVQFHQSVKQSFQTMCVRTCDGYYFPMSNTSNATVFVEDEDVCRAMCPGQKMELYVFRSPEEQVGQMRSLSGAPYSALPNAYKFQQGEISGCACEGQTERAAVPAPHEGGFVQSPSEDVITEGEALPSLVPGDTGGATSTVSVPDKPAIPLPSELMEVTPEEPSEKGVPVEEEKALPRKVEPKTGPIRQVGPKYFADQ